MNAHSLITEAANGLAAAIARHDDGAIRDVLAADFVLRSPGEPSVDASGFIAGIRQIPGEIVFVKLDDVVRARGIRSDAFSLCA